MAELVLALDVPDVPSAQRVLTLVPEATWVKVGSVLYTASGAALIAQLKEKDPPRRIFLDLKWHDIPNTVRGAVLRAKALGVDLVTVHTLGGPAMMAAAKEAAAGALRVVGVTVLTSHDEVELSTVLGREAELLEETVRLADLAREAGLDGVVASPVECGRLRALLGPTALIVTPGIRSPHDPQDDQARRATPQAAVAAGADLLVVGRPVIEAKDPRRAWNELSAALR
jgi:orotidine-5'-phosphate decarboxylase